MNKRKEVNFLYADEVISCLQFLEKTKPNLRPFIQLAFESGLRFEEIIEIKNRDIRIKSPQYYIVRFHRSKKKSFSQDFIFVRQSLMRDIRSFYNIENYYLFDNPCKKSSQSREKFKHALYKNLRYWLRKSIQKVLSLSNEQMKGIGLHITRRTFMTVGVLSKSFSFEEGSRNLGHSSLRVTEKYYLTLRRNEKNSVIDYFKLKGD